MAESPKRIQRRSVKISRHFPLKVYKLLCELHRTGLYGRTVNEVVERLVCRSLIEIAGGGCDG